MTAADIADPIDIDDVRRAAERLDGIAHRTPVVTSRTLDDRVGATVVAKAENLQRAGAFKFRGAYNKISTLDDEQRRRGVCGWSSGNHAQAVALASALLDTKATIVMPADAPAAKRSATVEYGAEVVEYDRYRDDREAIARKIADERGLTLVPAYDDPLVMAGQGTVAIELIEDAGPIDTLIVPMSGGGLMAGCGVAAHALLADITLIGVEPAAGDDTGRSLVAGERVRIPVPRTIADGLQVDIPGALTFPLNQKLVDEVLLVSDIDLVAAMRFAFERMKLVLEPSGAAALAALFTSSGRFQGRRVGIVLSGGNVGADRFATLISDGPPPQ